MASEMMRETADAIRSNRLGQADIDLATRRARMEEMWSGLPVPEDVQRLDLQMAGVPCRWLSCPGSRADRVVLYLHGGGYAMGSLDTHYELMARIARAARCRVLGVDYRLAPEHPFPAALEDSVAVYRALQRGARGARIAIAGDSAGGGLAVATLLRLRELGEPAPAAAVLFSPWTDLTGSSASYRSRATLDPMIEPGAVVDMARLYHGDHPADHPLISPLFANLQGLPPLLIQVGDHEVLLDDAVELAARAEAAGVTAQVRVFPEAFHVFQAMPQLPEAAQALSDMAGFLDANWK